MTRQSLSNYNWLVSHALAISDEYTKRYNKVHKSKAIIEWCRDFGGKPLDIGLTNFIQAMPKQYQQDDPVEAYRQYYIQEKFMFAEWKEPATKPAWFENKG